MTLEKASHVIESTKEIGQSVMGNVQEGKEQSGSFF
jgi:hypothetical protein